MSCSRSAPDDPLTPILAKNDSSNHSSLSVCPGSATSDNQPLASFLSITDSGFATEESVTSPKGEQAADKPFAFERPNRSSTRGSIPDSLEAAAQLLRDSNSLLSSLGLESLQLDPEAEPQPEQLAQSQPELPESVKFATNEPPAGSSLDRVEAASRSQSRISHQEIAESLEYFIACSGRVSHLMSRVLADPEAVRELLNERDTDVEVAARLGKLLLEQNLELGCRNTELESSIEQLSTELRQLRHVLANKDDEIAFFAQTTDEYYEAFDHCDLYPPTPATSADVTSLRQQIARLKQDNDQLVSHSTNISEKTRDLESHEQKLLGDCLRQLSSLSTEVQRLNGELAQRDATVTHTQGELRSFSRQLHTLDLRLRDSEAMNEGIHVELEKTTHGQRCLGSEVSQLRTRYDECTQLLSEASRELRRREARAAAETSREDYEEDERLVDGERSLAAELREVGRRRVAHYVSQLRDDLSEVSDTTGFDSACFDSDSAFPCTPRALSRVAGPSAPIPVTPQSFKKKLEMVKRMEGSVTLHNWRRLAEGGSDFVQALGNVATPPSTPEPRTPAEPASPSEADYPVLSPINHASLLPPPPPPPQQSTLMTLYSRLARLAPAAIASLTEKHHSHSGGLNLSPRTKSLLEVPSTAHIATSLSLQHLGELHRGRGLSVSFDLSSPSGSDSDGESHQSPLKPHPEQGTIDAQFTDSTATSSSQQENYTDVMSSPTATMSSSNLFSELDSLPC